MAHLKVPKGCHGLPHGSQEGGSIDSRQAGAIEYESTPALVSMITFNDGNQLRFDQAA